MKWTTYKDTDTALDYAPPTRLDRLIGFLIPDERTPQMRTSLPASPAIAITPNSVIPPKANIAQDAPDPTKDPGWVVMACLWYGPDFADPYEAYADLAARDERNQSAA